jgi:hypothetical protein
VTGKSHLDRDPGCPQQAELAILVVTHRYERAHRLLLEQFQIAE